jgi:hypothetical protein
MMSKKDCLVLGTAAPVAHGEKPFVARRTPPSGRRRADRFSFVLMTMLAGLLAVGAMAGDLSGYRNFAFGAAVETVAEQVGGARSETSVLHHRPALIQEISWRPQPPGPSVHNESAEEVTFTFLDDKLYRVEVVYDRNETKGLTNQDLVAAISEQYGVASIPARSQAAQEQVFGDQGEVLAEWRDEQHRFELWRFAYGPTFKLVGLQVGLESKFRNALAEAERLDALEAPAQEAARAAKADDAAKAADKASRTRNKPNFRP